MSYQFYWEERFSGWSYKTIVENTKWRHITKSYLNAGESKNYRFKPNFSWLLVINWQETSIENFKSNEYLWCFKFCYTTNYKRKYNLSIFICFHLQTLQISISAYLFSYIICRPLNNHLYLLFWVESWMVWELSFVR